MSLENMYIEWISRCENFGRLMLSPIIIEGLSFCNNVCYSEWLWKKERAEDI